MTVEFTEDELKFLQNMLAGATIQGIDAMRVLIAIMDKLKAAAGD